MSKSPAKPYNRFWYRFLEIFPGASVWIALISPFILSKYYPLPVTIFIICFDAFWLQKSIVTAFTLYIGYRRMRRNLHTDWQARLHSVEKMSEAERQERGWIAPSDIYHVVIIPEYKEEEATLISSIDSISRADYDLQKIIVVLATEGRDGENARKVAANLTSRYKNTFKLFLATEHPDGMVGEVKGKGANADWAARIMTKEVEKLGIPYENVVVSTADADTRFVKPYFASLSYVYATTPKRTRNSYQPIATFLNNVWEASMISRVMAFATTFWQLSESVRDYRLLTFSTHAMSLQTLIDMDYWCTSIVNEDSRQFFRAYFHYEGDFHSIPLFMPVYMDAVHFGNTWGTFKNLYLQQQRWAYGVEHFPYIVLESLKHKTIKWSDRLGLVWRAYHGSFSWGTNAFFMAVVGWLPIALNNSFRDQVIASNFPIVTSYLLAITWIGTIVCNIISFKLLPPLPAHKKRSDFIPMIAMWLLVPICTIFFGAIPGIDSQTRLMLGKYMGFRVTPKKAV